MRTSRVISLVLIVVLVVLINLPFAHARWTALRIDRADTNTSATVTNNRVNEGAYFVEFVYPIDVDARQSRFFAQVGRTAYDRATSSGQIVVDRLPGNIEAFRVQGEVTSRGGLIFTILADLAMVATIVLYTRLRPRYRPELVLVATEDLEVCEPGSVLERIDGGLYVVAGEVQAIEGDEIVLDLGDRRVRVHLDGHHNPAGFQQPVQVTGRMVA